LADDCDAVCTAEEGGAGLYVHFTLTVEGVTESNFESMKPALTDVFAASFNVDADSIDLELPPTARRELSASRTIDVKVFAEVTEMNAIIAQIKGPTYVTDLQSAITTAAASDSTLSGLTVNAATEPTIEVETTTSTTSSMTSTTTTSNPSTTTTTVAGSSAILMPFMAFIVSALVF